MNLVTQLTDLGARIDAALQRSDFARANALAESAIVAVSTPALRLAPQEIDMILRWGEQFYRWRLWDLGASYWSATLAAVTRLRCGLETIERAQAFVSAMRVLGGRVSDVSPEAVKALSLTRSVFGENHVLTQSVAAKVMSAPPTPTAAPVEFVSPATPATSPTPAPTEAFTLRLHDVGAQKIMMIKVVRELSGLGLAAAKELIERAPPIDVKVTARNVNMARTGPELTSYGCRWEVVSNALEAPPAPSPAGVGWLVMLDATGANKIMVVKEIREVAQCGLREAMDLFEQAPSRFALRNPRIAAEQVAQRFAAVGARVRVVRD